MKSTFRSFARAPLALAMVVPWASVAWLGCDSIAGIQEGTLVPGDAGDASLADGTPNDAIASGDVAPSADVEASTVDAPFDGPADGPVDAPAETSVVCTTPAPVACGGNCVDTATDPYNCGVCGQTCTGTTCSSGYCIPQVMCDGTDNDAGIANTGNAARLALENVPGVGGPFFTGYFGVEGGIL